MSSMNPVSAGGFSSAAGHYSRSRPTYAREAVGLMVDEIPPGAILDVGAGTGILTGQLRRAGREVHACEPLPEMLAQLGRSLPDVPAFAAVAEALPIGAARYAGVTIAQAFHWMDFSAALSEVARVLDSAGVLCLLWNVRDESVRWVADLTDLVENRSGGRPYSDHRERVWSEVVAEEGGFEHLIGHRWSNPVPTTLDLVLERVRSTSFVAVMEESARESLLSEARELLLANPGMENPTFDYPHHTVLDLWQVPG